MSRTKHEPLTIVRILNSQNKELSSTTSILSKLFRIILADLNVRVSDYNRLVNQWLDDPIYGIPNDSKRRSTIRGNLNKEIVRSDMSMRTFLKALSASTGTESFKLILKLKRKGARKETEHEINIPNLPMIVAQFIHDSPDRTGRKTRIKVAEKVTEEKVSFIKQKDLDEIADDIDEIASATITTYRRNSPVTIHQSLGGQNGSEVITGSDTNRTE